MVFAKAYPAAAIPSFLNGSIPMTLAPPSACRRACSTTSARTRRTVAPRLGFAYEAFPNTVVRGAFGIYFNLMPASYVGTAPFGTLPFEGSQTYTNSSTGAPGFTMDNPFSATGAFTSNPSVSAMAKLATPYTEEYNLAVEHQFSKGLDIRIGYVGQHNLKQNNYGGSGNYDPNINLANPPVVGVAARARTSVQPFSAISYLIDPSSTVRKLTPGRRAQAVPRWVWLSVRSTQWTRVLGTENIENPSGATPQRFLRPDRRPYSTGAGFELLLSVAVRSWAAVTRRFRQPCQQDHQRLADLRHHRLPDRPAFLSDILCVRHHAGLVSGRANRVPGVPLYPAVKTRAQWFNPAAFQAPPCCTVTGYSETCPAAVRNGMCHAIRHLSATLATTCSADPDSRTGT